MNRKSLKSYFNNYLFFVLGSVLSFSCKRCDIKDNPENYDLIEPTQPDISWINFNDGDTLIFKNNLNQFDTFFIKTSTEFYNDPIIGGSYNECETYKIPQFKTYGIDDTSNHAMVSVQSPNSNCNSGTKITWVNSINNNISFYRILLNESSYSTILVNGTFYDSVGVIQVDTVNFSNSMVWRIFYQKEKGLLRYDQLGGISWERIN